MTKSDLKFKAMMECIDLYQEWYTLSRKKYLWDFTKDPLKNPYDKLIKNLVFDDKTDSYRTSLIKHFIDILKNDEDILHEVV